MTEISDGPKLPTWIQYQIEAPASLTGRTYTPQERADLIENGGKVIRLSEQASSAYSPEVQEFIADEEARIAKEAGGY